MTVPITGSLTSAAAYSAPIGMPAASTPDAAPVGTQSHIGTRAAASGMQASTSPLNDAAGVGQPAQDRSGGQAAAKADGKDNTPDATAQGDPAKAQANEPDPAPASTALNLKGLSEEQQVLTLQAQGLNLDQIAVDLDISVAEVDSDLQIAPPQDNGSQSASSSSSNPSAVPAAPSSLSVFA